ncbi:MAG: hypothetical protein J6252_00715 [Clostridia bacterium]|nr:hypothetical protein [Clostridia bacterium]
MNKKIIITIIAAVLIIAAAVFAVLYTSGEGAPAQPGADKPETQTCSVKPGADPEPAAGSEPASDPESKTKVDTILEEMNKAFEEGRALPYENRVFVVVSEFPEVTYDEAGNPVSAYGLPITEYAVSSVSLEYPENRTKSLKIRLAEGCDLREALFTIYSFKEVLSAVPDYAEAYDYWNMR